MPVWQYICRSLCIIYFIGLQRKATGILKNAGKTDEATTGQQQVKQVEEC